MPHPDGTPTFVLIPGSGATSFMWSPLVRELAVRGHRALPVELPQHGFDTVFPEGFASPQDPGLLATAPAPVAALALADSVEHTLDLVRRAATHGPVVLVGHSLGGSTVTGVANAAPELLAGTVYVCAYLCVDQPNVPAYVARPDPGDVLAQARRKIFVGDPSKTGSMRMNPRDGSPEVLALQHELMMAEADPARVPAMLNYALQPDESLRLLIADARIDPAAWGGVPHTFIRTGADRVIPPEVQDRMITEADAATGPNSVTGESAFTVHEVDAGHMLPLTRPAELAELLIGSHSR